MTLFKSLVNVVYDFIHTELQKYNLIEIKKNPVSLYENDTVVHTIIEIVSLLSFITEVNHNCIPITHV